jgi:Flp pilus assembly protein TadB
MPAQPSSPRTRTSSFRRRIAYGQPDLRVSDAERSEVADRLAEHYGEGRLDQSEFNERVEQAMRAKTRSDIAGLFDDLPDGEAPEVTTRPRRRRSYHPLLIAALIVAVIVAAQNMLWWPHLTRLAIVAGLVLVVLYLIRGRAHHHDHQDHQDHYDHGDDPPSQR